MVVNVGREGEEGSKEEEDARDKGQGGCCCKCAGELKQLMEWQNGTFDGGRGGGWEARSCNRGEWGGRSTWEQSDEQDKSEDS